MSDSFVPIAPRPSPAKTSGPVYWVRRNLFADWRSAVTTLFVLGLLVWALPGLWRWLVGDAVFQPDADACQAARGVVLADVSHPVRQLGVEGVTVFDPTELLHFATALHRDGSLERRARGCSHDVCSYISATAAGMHHHGRASLDATAINLYG